MALDPCYMPLAGNSQAAWLNEMTVCVLGFFADLEYSEEIVTPLDFCK